MTIEEIKERVKNNEKIYMTLKNSGMSDEEINDALRMMDEE